MSIILGKKYKIDKVRLQWYCHKYGWSKSQDRLGPEYVTPTRESSGGTNHLHITCYFFEKYDYYIPEDCLIDERKEKLEKILCLK